MATKTEWTKFQKQINDLTKLHTAKITKKYKVDPRAEKIANIIFPKRGDRPFGCRSNYVADIFSEFAGYRVVVKDGSHDVTGSMIVILKTSSEAAHYPVNEPILFTDNRIGFVQSRNGAMKDQGGIRFEAVKYGTQWRFATPAEIKAFFSTPKLSFYGGWTAKSVLSKLDSKYASIRAALLPSKLDK